MSRLHAKDGDFAVSSAKSTTSPKSSLDEFDQIILRDWLADSWSRFESFCNGKGADANDIYVKLGGEPE